MPNLDSELELEAYLENFFHADFLNGVDRNEWQEDLPGGFPFRQLNIKGYGVMDILLLDYSYDQHCFYINLNIVELKKGTIDYEAIGQICRYKTSVDRFLNRFPDLKNKLAIEVDGWLIGNSINLTTDAVYIANSIDWLTLCTYDISLDNGIEIHASHSNWSKTNEDFSDLDIRFLQYFQKYIKPVYKGYLREKRIHEGLAKGNR